MSWQSKYVVCRPNQTGKAFEEVFYCDEIKKARYWMQYIAEINDVLFMTPAHPKNDSSDKLAYYAHKAASGMVENNQNSWQENYSSYQHPNAQKEMNI